MALAAALLAGCTSSDGPVEVAVPPAGGPDVDAACAALLERLPDEVDPGVTRRPVEPDAGRTAAWGDPAVVLECGVELPERDEPPFVVNGVGFTTRDTGSATRWTTYGRTVPTSVTVPDGYNGAEIIIPLAEPLDGLPADPSAPPLLPEPGS